MTSLDKSDSSRKNAKKGTGLRTRRAKTIRTMREAPRSFRDSLESTAVVVSE